MSDKPQIARTLGFFTAIIILILNGVTAQENFQLKPENGDCNHPVQIKDTLIGPTTPPVGYGSEIEISGDKKSLYEFETEHNTVWYFFKAPADCILSFDIIPTQLKDDYDFILYKYNGRNFCRDVKEKKVIPVRSCISRNNLALQSKTGLSADATEPFIHSGPGASYSQALPVKKSEIFYLVVDNVYPGGKGHSVHLKYSGCRQAAATATGGKNKTVPETRAPENVVLKITVVDKKTQKPLRGDIDIFYQDKANGVPLFSADSSSAADFTLELAKAFLVKVTSDGYFDYSRELKTTYLGGSLSIKAELDRIEVGSNVVFDDILFYGNEARFLPESNLALNNLYTTLKKYQSMKIEIQGHVNCPSTYEDCDKMEEFNMNLSVARAEAVYNYLVEKGIAPGRLTYKGYGATKMLYPDARSEEKMKKNRRVEVVVQSF